MLQLLSISLTLFAFCAGVWLGEERLFYVAIIAGIMSVSYQIDVMGEKNDPK
jgi:hypothetical protein